MIHSHKTQFAGYPIEPFDPSVGITKPDHIYRITAEWEGPNWSDLMAQYLENPEAANSRGLIVGAWMGDQYDRDSNVAVEALVNATAKLPKLHALFIGDIVGEENEISWIEQSNLGGLFATYPQLTHFGARGGNGLRFGRFDAPNLTTLIVETGGMNAKTATDILRSSMPNLEHLELWIGTEDYGRSVEIEMLAPLLSGNLFPNLRYLGLRNADIADDIATAIVNSPLLDRVETLDLSLGTLTDIGGRALLNSERVRNLKKLDLHHHFLSDELMAQLEALPLIVDVSGQEDDEDGDWRFVAVGE